MRNWYVLSTKPSKEGQVELMFGRAGFEIYCPKHMKEGRVRPFFPGYAFLRFEYPLEFNLVKYTRGVKKVIGNDSGPIPIPDDTILGIRARESGGLIMLGRLGREPEVGDDIEVAEGPLKGLRGVFLKELTDRERVMILMNYVSYQGTVLIERNKLKKSPGR